MGKKPGLISILALSVSDFMSAESANRSLQEAGSTTATIHRKIVPKKMLPRDICRVILLVLLVKLVPIFFS
jgi:hypothetical protein